MLNRLSNALTPRFRSSARGSDRSVSGDEARTSCASDWEHASEGPFGTVLSEESLVEVDGIKIPTVLAVLWRTLLAAGGLEMEGIFRISASYTALAGFKQALSDSGDSEDAMCRAISAADGHTLAALIKAYLREVPEDLWAPVRSELTAQLASAADGDDNNALSAAAPQLVTKLHAREGSLVVFVTRCMAAVHAHESANSMGRTAIGTVFAPALVRPADDADPQTMLDWTDHAVLWALALLGAHQKEPLDAPESAKALRVAPPAVRSLSAGGSLDARLAACGGSAPVRARARRGSTIQSKSVSEIVESTLAIGRPHAKADPAGGHWLYMRTAEEILARCEREWGASAAGGASSDAATAPRAQLATVLRSALEQAKAAESHARSASALQAILASVLEGGSALPLPPSTPLALPPPPAAPQEAPPRAEGGSAAAEGSSAAAEGGSAAQSVPEGSHAVGDAEGSTSIRANILSLRLYSMPTATELMTARPTLLAALTEVMETCAALKKARDFEACCAVHRRVAEEAAPRCAVKPICQALLKAIEPFSPNGDAGDLLEQDLLADLEEAFDAQRRVAKKAPQRAACNPTLFGMPSVVSLLDEYRAALKESPRHSARHSNFS